MRRLPTLASLLLATALILPGVSAQIGFPRDRNEALALRLVTAFRQSLAREAAWENARRQLREMIAEVATAGHEIPHAIDMEDVAMLNRVDSEVAAEKAWPQKHIGFWDKDLAASGGSVLAFRWCYSALAEGMSAKDLDLVERNVRTIPFAETAAHRVATVRSAFDGKWHTHRKQGGSCCSFEGDAKTSFTTDATGLTAVGPDGLFVNSRGRVTGTSLAIDYGIVNGKPDDKPRKDQPAWVCRSNKKHGRKLGSSTSSFRRCIQGFPPT